MFWVLNIFDSADHTESRCWALPSRLDIVQSAQNHRSILTKVQHDVNTFQHLVNHHRQSVRCGHISVVWLMRHPLIFFPSRHGLDQIAIVWFRAGPHFKEFGFHGNPTPVREDQMANSVVRERGSDNASSCIKSFPISDAWSSRKKYEPLELHLGFSSLWPWRHCTVLWNSQRSVPSDFDVWKQIRFGWTVTWLDCNISWKARVRFEACCCMVCMVWIRSPPILKACCNATPIPSIQKVIHCLFLAFLLSRRFHRCKYTVSLFCHAKLFILSQSGAAFSVPLNWRNSLLLSGKPEHALLLSLSLALLFWCHTCCELIPSQCAHL